MFNAEFYKHILDKINSHVYITDVETDKLYMPMTSSGRAFRTGASGWKNLLERTSKKE